MKIVTKGVTRVVLVFDTFVVKIPKFYVQWDHFLKGIIGNIEEGRTWRYNSGKYERGYSHLLCPVKWTSWGGWILIMARAKEIPREDWAQVNMKAHLKYFKGDDSISNYGYYNHSLVKIDYASLDDHWGEDFKHYYEQPKAKQ